jgi:DNA-binding NtrC family response regulator
VPFPELMRRIESELLEKALQIKGKTRREIAEMLQTRERTLYHKISSYRHGSGSQRTSEVKTEDLEGV